MKHQPYSKPLPYSLMASMYAGWEEYKVPAVYYQYLLAILPNLQKKQQVLLMTRQVKSLKANSHPYHRIINVIEARERSLSAIQASLHILFQFQSTSEMEWPEYKNTDLDFGNDSQASDYKLVHEDSRGPIMSPSPRKSDRKTQLLELLNHIRMYRKVTLQIIYLVAQWQHQILEFGYQENIVQFQYHQQDYLIRINTDIAQILNTYQSFFQNNPFLLLKRNHQKSQFALIYSQLKPDSETVKKMHECMNILSTHQANILKFRMLAKHNQKSYSRRYLTKSTDIHKIYMNYNQGRDYIMVQDSQAMKKSKIIHDPPHINSLKSDHQLKTYKNDILINPQGLSPIPVDKTIKKHPVIIHSHMLTQNSRVDLRTPQMPVYNKAPYTPNQRIPIKRSQTDGIGLKKHASMDQRGMRLIRESKKLGKLYDENIEVQQVHGKNMISISKGSGSDNNREDSIDRNMGYSMQRKLQVINDVNGQKKYKERPANKNGEMKMQEPIPIPDKNEQNRQQTTNGIQMGQQKQQELGELSQDNKINLIFQESVKSTQIVKYLRNKVFNNVQVGFEEIQALAKKLLLEKDFVTFVRVESKGMKVAWLAVKFMQKDNTMRRTVFILYVRKFLRLSNFQRKLLDLFVSHGYGIIRNKEKILYEVDILEIVTRPLVKIKFKVNQYVDKSQIKAIMKKNKNLLNSRILKYHSYSKTTKYHKYCQHQRNYCMIGYNFLELKKISIERNSYLQAKADKITKVGDEVYKIWCMVNDTELVIARSFTDILGLEKQAQIQKDSSFDSKCETEYAYVAIRSGKFMRKYVNETDQPIISQFVTVNSQIPEVKSVMIPKDEVPTNMLVIDPPFFIAIMNRDEEESKSLAVMEFQ